MSEQQRTTPDLEKPAADNSPAAGSGDRPSAGAHRRTDPAEPNPAANQRAGEAPVDGSDGVNDAEQGGAASSQPSDARAHADRKQGSSDAGSPAAAAGERPVPDVEQSVDDAAGSTHSASHDRAVTGVHRPSAPSGEVSPS